MGATNKVFLISSRGAGGIMLTVAVHGSDAPANSIMFSTVSVCCAGFQVLTTIGPPYSAMPSYSGVHAIERMHSLVLMPCICCCYCCLSGTAAVPARWRTGRATSGCAELFRQQQNKQ
jgi:hypothetical protein